MSKDAVQPDRIRVMIVDDHPLMRDGLKTCVLSEPDIELVAEASSGEQALSLCETVQPDLVLMDLKMPGMGGVAATQAIRERYPQVQVLALTSFAEKDMIQGALQARAIGYLLKDVAPEKLAEAIREAVAGRPTLSPEVTQALIESSLSAPAIGHDLTPREREVLALLVEGLSNPQIAQSLSIQRTTVKFHVRNILSRLGVANRIEAAILASQHKLIP